MSHLTNLAMTEDGFAFDSSTGESYTVNRSGQLVIQRLQQGNNQQEIAQFLAEKFCISLTLAERDLADFFQQLHTLGMTASSFQAR